MATPDRTSITISKPRFEQLAAIAARRGLPSVAALLDDFVREAITAGEIPDRIGGYGVVHDESSVMVTIASHSLPSVDHKTAKALAYALDAAAPISQRGGMPVEGPLVLKPLSKVSVDLGTARLDVGRAGRGVRLELFDNTTGETTTWVAPANLVAEIIRMIRAAVGGF